MTTQPDSKPKEITLNDTRAILYLVKRGILKLEVKP